MANQLTDALRERILILDGAMGTMIQRRSLEEADFRGERYSDHNSDLVGCNDLLSLTLPQIIEDIHTEFLQAGADIIETNTFSANAISLADYEVQADARAMNLASAKVACRAAAAMTARTPERPRFVAGSMGPTTKTASLSSDVEDPAFRGVTFDELEAAYYEQAKALIDGGVHLLVAETATDTLNMKAALYAVRRLFDEGARRLPVFSSVTITDRSGRTLSGQTTEAYWNSIAHAPLTAVGINCALGADDMRPYVEEMSRVATLPTFCYPNAGLPNEFGGYDDTPEKMARLLGEFARDGLLNLVGGCCGTTPEHIAAIAAAVEDVAPRALPVVPHYTRLSGLEPLTLTPESNFTMIGERTNVAGSRKFKRLILEEKYEEAVEVARQQVESGANIIDICMDEGMLDAAKAMKHFLNLIAAEPDIATVPVMLDSSKFAVIETGLKCLQGKGVVNSISLKEGEDEFLRQARIIHRYGAAVVVMGFDETGQATTVDHRITIATRAYKLLTEVGFAPDDIIFDPNILTVATGIEEHDDYAVNFIEATRRIKELFPRTKISGGVSNISFSFQGNNTVREAMHSAFLFHAIRAGLDMGIVNAGQLTIYEEIPDELRQHVEDVLLARRPDATERLVELATRVAGASGSSQQRDTASWRSGTLQERIAHALLKGTHEFIDVDIAEALHTYDAALDIIEGPLMDGMNIVGEFFGAGKMFLPQVVKSARVMKKAVAILEPVMNAQNDKRSSKGTIVIATVKGDVHDIGKNIVAVVLRCNGYNVVDLGVMVPTRTILDAVVAESASMVGLSGLITPSLDEMIGVAKEMQRREMNVPLLIGGATTSSKHTAVKIAPAYSGLTVHVRDASLAAGVAGTLSNPERRAAFSEENSAKQERLRKRHAETTARRNLVAIDAARSNRFVPTFETPPAKPSFLGLREVEPSVRELSAWIDWTPFFHAWELKGIYPDILDDERIGERARELLADGKAMLSRIIDENLLHARGVYGFFPAAASGDDIIIYSDDICSQERAKLFMLRQQQSKKVSLCLADFLAPAAPAGQRSEHRDYIGAFAVQAGQGLDDVVAAYEADHDDYNAIMAKAIADRLAEAFAEWLHNRARADWGIGDDTVNIANLLQEQYRGIRPAFGYPACPDHSEKLTLFSLLDATAHTGITLTESMAMVPTAAVSGLYFAHPDARYFSVGKLGRDQLEDYAKRKGSTREEQERWLPANLGY